MAAGAVWSGSGPLGGLDDALTVDGAHLDAVIDPAAASQASFHCTQVASLSGFEISAGSQSPPSTLTSTPSTPRSGAQATPAMAMVPASTVLPRRGTSMRDCVRIGASLAQPRGTQ